MTIIALTRNLHCFNFRIIISKFLNKINSFSETTNNTPLVVIAGFKRRVFKPYFIIIFSFLKPIVLRLVGFITSGDQTWNEIKELGHQRSYDHKRENLSKYHVMIFYGFSLRELDFLPVDLKTKCFLFYPVPRTPNSNMNLLDHPIILIRHLQIRSCFA